MPAFTRSQVDAIAIGSLVARSIDGVRFSPAEPVTRIFGKGDNVSGELYVCFYARFGANAEMSGSISEGDTLDGRLYRIVEGPVAPL